MKIDIELIFPDGFDTETDDVQTMIAEINTLVESFPDDATILHLRLSDSLEFKPNVLNRIKWYMNQIREFISIARPDVVIICNQFDMQTEDNRFISADFDLPDEISKELLMSICYNLLSVIDESKPQVDTSTAEIVLPS